MHLQIGLAHARLLLWPDRFDTAPAVSKSAAKARARTARSPQLLGAIRRKGLGFRLCCQPSRTEAARALVFARKGAGRLTAVALGIVGQT